MNHDSINIKMKMRTEKYLSMQKMVKDQNERVGELQNSTLNKMTCGQNDSRASSVIVFD